MGKEKELVSYMQKILDHNHDKIIKESKNVQNCVNTMCKFVHTEIVKYVNRETKSHVKGDQTSKKSRKVERRLQEKQDEKNLCLKRIDDVKMRRLEHEQKFAKQQEMSGKQTEQLSARYKNELDTHDTILKEKAKYLKNKLK